MAQAPQNKPTGYAKYVNQRTFGLAVGAFTLIIALPMPSSMLDVGVEYTLGTKVVLDHLARDLFGKPYTEVEQWQAASAQALEAAMMQGVSTKATLLKRDRKALAKVGVVMAESHFERYRDLIRGMDDEALRRTLIEARELRLVRLTYAQLSEADKKIADRAAGHLKLCIAMVVFVVLCFVTEAIPLPGVAFCIGLILVFGGVAAW